MELDSGRLVLGVEGSVQLPQPRRLGSARIRHARPLGSGREGKVLERVGNSRRGRQRGDLARAPALTSSRALSFFLLHLRGRNFSKNLGKNKEKKGTK